MHPRLRLTLIAASLASLALVLGVAALSDRGESSGSQVASSDRSPFEGALMPPRIPAPDFTLRDEEGKRVRMADYRGRPVIVTFLYTTCEDTCPLEAQQIRGAVDRLADDGEDIPALAIAVNPPSDTAARARRFLTEQRVFGRLRFVLGSRAELRPVWRGFFIQPQGEKTEHQARVVIIDRDGFQRVGYPGQKLTPDALAHDVRVLLDEQRRSAS